MDKIKDRNYIDWNYAVFNLLMAVGHTWALDPPARIEVSGYPSKYRELCQKIAGGGWHSLPIFESNGDSGVWLVRASGRRQRYYPHP